MHVISSQDLRLALMGFEIICCNFLAVVVISGQDLHPESLLISKLVVGGGVDFERCCFGKNDVQKEKLVDFSPSSAASHSSKS